MHGGVHFWEKMESECAGIDRFGIGRAGHDMIIVLPVRNTLRNNTLTAHPVTRIDRKRRVGIIAPLALLELRRWIDQRGQDLYGAKPCNAKVSGEHPPQFPPAISSDEHVVGPPAGSPAENAGSNPRPDSAERIGQKPRKGKP